MRVRAKVAVVCDDSDGKETALVKETQVSVRETSCSERGWDCKC
jgi:hypothetical protein